MGETMNRDYMFKYDNVMDEVIGKDGISIADIGKIENKIESAYNGILEKAEAGELGFIDILDSDLSQYDKVKEHSKDFEYIIVVGMGGSVLGTQMVHEAINGLYYNEYSSPKVYFLDNSDPEKTYRILKLVDLEKTLVFAVSKSGNTVETLANFFIIRNLMMKKVDDYEKNIVTIANGGTLKELTEKENYMFFEIPENVGGRYSVLSAVGLAPLSCLGIDIEKLVKGAIKMNNSCNNEDVFKNPALMNAVIHYLMYNKGKNMSVIMPYAERLHKFGMWYRQLWAESLGKDGKGQTPIVSMGAKDQHSQLQLYIDGPKDKIVTFMRVNKFKYDLKINHELESNLNNHNLSEIINSEQSATEASLTCHGVPNVKVVLEELNELSLGKLLYMYELQTAFSGELHGVNAFNQPAVEQEKEIAREILRGTPLEELMCIENYQYNGKYTISCD